MECFIQYIYQCCFEGGCKLLSGALWLLAMLMFMDDVVLMAESNN